MFALPLATLHRSLMSRTRNAPPEAPAPHTTVHGGAMSAAEWAMLLGLSLIWGGSFFFNKILLGAFDTLTIMLGRVGIAAVALVVVLHLAGGRLPRSWPAWRIFIGMSVLNNLVPFALILWGQKHIASGLAAILNATTPLFAAVLAHALAGERLTAHRLVGVLIGLAGVAVMMGPDLIADGLGGNVLAQLAVLGAAFSYGVSSLYGRRLAALKIPSQVGAAGQLVISTIVVLPLVALIDQPWNLPMPSWQVWAAMAALSLLSTAFAYVIFFRLLSGAGGVNASLVTLLVPVSALLLGTLVLNEAFTLRQAAGMAVILLGLVVTDGRAVARARRALAR
jgi:drug/metabolite transporter (DMT)-like permease